MNEIWYFIGLGKGGSNVNRLKEETGVTINIPDERSSTIRIEGTPNGVNQAKAELMEMVTKMENEREKDILIEHSFHKNIIGAKGEKIREIRDMFHQVRVICVFNNNQLQSNKQLLGASYVPWFFGKERRGQNSWTKTRCWCYL